ncbi:hypothetical protein QUF58_10950 [Anaerolineales bacterium HSG24]|nr:hypothetical protein [Anaerolineales bacterium HSG24]
MMDFLSVYEIIGYIASILVAVSLTMSSILKLRVINLIGAACFTVYGLLIAAYPVAAVNFIIVLIDLYYLYEIYVAKEYFNILGISNNSKYLKYFLNFHDQDIKQFFPSFSYTPSEQQFVFFVLRNLVPTGLFVGEIRDKDSLFIKLDYVIPGYRDFKIDKFVYSENLEFFKEQGFREIHTLPSDKKHESHLRRMGFVPDNSNNTVTSYYLVLN